MAVIAGARTWHQIRATVRAGFMPIMKISWISSPIALAFAQKFLPEQTWVPFFNIVAFVIGTYINTHTKRKRLAALRKKVGLLARAPVIRSNHVAALWRWEEPFIWPGVLANAAGRILSRAKTFGREWLYNQTDGRTFSRCTCFADVHAFPDIRCVCLLQICKNPGTRSMPCFLVGPVFSYLCVVMPIKFVLFALVLPTSVPSEVSFDNDRRLVH